MTDKRNIDAPVRQNSWLVTLSLALGAVAYLTLVWLPGHRTIKELSQQVEARRAFVAQSAGLSKTLVGVIWETEKVDSIVAEWKKAAPTPRDLSDLYAKIDVLANSAHLAIDRFDPQPAIVHERLREIPITISLSGQFAQVFEFLRTIEGLPATIWVESLRIEKPVATTKDVQCELSLVVFSDNSESSDYANRSD